MSTHPPSDSPKVAHDPSQGHRATALPGRFEEPFARQYERFNHLSDAAFNQMTTVSRQRLLRAGERDPWAVTQPPSLGYAHTYPGTAVSSAQSTQTLPQISSPTSTRTPGSYGPFGDSTKPAWSPDEWSNRQQFGYQDSGFPSPWPAAPQGFQYPTQLPMSSHDRSQRSSYTGWHSSWPGPLLRRTSSDDTRLGKAASGYYGDDASSSVTSLHGRTHPQRRPSNRDEFDGPSQLLEKPEEDIYEPKEEDLPPLPITLYAQEQDEILAQVNDRLSQCAFDFIARYQFPIPIEPDKRPVRVPGDREWSEWVYLLKRLATKRRVPARVLYNGQIKQLITILENSLEMRHAAKHQSRPLKDDRNILQLISSGLQVAKILKDAPAMKYLDGLYVHTERVIQSRRIPVPVTPAYSTA